jgi:hypothetical protein
MMPTRLNQLRYLSLSPAMQNTEDQSHNIGRQQKCSSSQQEKLQRLKSIWNKMSEMIATITKRNTMK